MRSLVSTGLFRCPALCPACSPGWRPYFVLFCQEPLLRASHAAVVERPGPSRGSVSTPPLVLRRLPQLLRNLFAALLDPLRRAVLRDTASRTATRVGTTIRTGSAPGSIAVGLPFGPHLLYALSVRQQEEAHGAPAHEVG